MWKKLIIIVLLIPYIITFLMNGSEMTNTVSISGNRQYLIVEKEDEQKKLSLKEYGMGILAKEIDVKCGIEALKAQAVLIRTSIYKLIQEEGSEVVHNKEYWTRSQMKENWGTTSYAENYKKIEEAWIQTEGQVLIYDGNLIYTPYHKLSNGNTRSGKEVFGTEEYPYLVIKKCKEDKNSEDLKTISLISESEVEIVEKDSAGYVMKVKCSDGTISGEEFRNKYHLASSCFTVQKYENQSKITTKGLGHGLGMSQNYANIMANKGKSYEEILEFFYEETELEVVAEIVVQ